MTRFKDQATAATMARSPEGAVDDSRNSDTPTWRPDGGPEAIRAGFDYSPAAIARFRAHRVSGGHQKWPDQTAEFDGDWYVRPPRAAAETELRKLRDSLRPAVADRGLFDRLAADDGRCGGADWRLDGGRVTSTSIWSAFYACRILEVAPRARSVVDIGGGYGHLAHLLAEFFPAVTLVELPEVLRLAAAWTDRVRLARPDEEWGGELVVNTMSMQHMTPANLAFYGERMLACGANWLYLVNRLVASDQTDTPMQHYPFLGAFAPVSLRRIGPRHAEAVFTRRPAD